MIRGRVANVVERFARDSDDVRLANFERVCSFHVAGKLLGRPTKYSLPDLAPLRANWDFGADSSDSVSGSIYQHDMNVAIRFHFCVNDASCERVPLLFRRHSLCRAGQFHIRPKAFPLVNLRWRD